MIIDLSGPSTNDLVNASTTIGNTAQSGANTINAIPPQVLTVIVIIIIVIIAAYMFLKSRY
jgi:uncharacterized membrane protein YfcA